MNTKAKIKKSNSTPVKEIILSNNLINEILQRAEKLNLPNWYLGAGCIAQTIWNYFHGYDLNKYINDYDLVYFDNSDLSYEAENKIIEKVKNEFKDLQINLDVKNQARVHVWYKEHFCYAISPYKNIEEAIDTWPTTATSIGVKIINDEFIYYAPFGTHDILSMIAKPNKVQITKEIYESKVERWKNCWPELKIEEW